MTPGSTVMRWLGMSTSMIRLSRARPINTPSGSGKAPPDRPVPCPRDERDLLRMTQSHYLPDLFGCVGKNDTARLRAEPGEAVGFVREQLVWIAEDSRRSDNALEAAEEVDIQHV